MPAAERKQPGHPFGIHRVLDKEPRLPQAADRLDNSLPIYSNEILIKVERLNIDAASFVQMEQETGKHAAQIARIVMENCQNRGKQQNKVTGSGGMLIGTIAQIGKKYKGPVKLKVGQRVATLVSLTLTPLHLDEIKQIHFQTHQIEVEGHAVLFESSILAPLPTDMPESVAMSVFDVAGAPATVDALCSRGKTLVVLGGGGKAGILSCVAGRQKVGKSGKVYAIEPHPDAARDLRALGVCNEVLEINAKDPIAVHSSVQKLTRGKMGDIVVNVASVPDTEVATILCTKARGTALFFGMATSFTKVALGAEGVASSAKLLFGNGYYPKHGQFALALLRKHKGLKALFHRRYGQS